MAYSWLCSIDSQHSCIFLSPLHSCWHYKHSQLYFCILTINDLPISGCYVGNILLFDIMIAEHNIMLVIWVCVCRRTSYTDSRIKDTGFYLFLHYLSTSLSAFGCLSVHLFEDFICALKGQKRVSNPLVLELWMLKSHHVGNVN